MNITELKIGDPIQVRFVELNGVVAKEVWIWATVCTDYDSVGGAIGVAFADGKRKMCRRSEVR